MCIPLELWSLTGQDHPPTSLPQMFLLETKPILIFFSLRSLGMRGQCSSKQHK